VVVSVAAAALASTSVFVGRQTELRTLDDAYRKASAGHSQILLVVCDAGIGKTTLVERFLSGLPDPLDRSRERRRD
jgi:GTPase SAR1 family protein